MSENPCYALEVRSERFWVCLRGEIDLSCAPDLNGVVAAYAASLPCGVVVSLREVTFLAVAGLRFLADLRREAQLRGRCLSLEDVPVGIGWVIELGGLGELLPA